MSLTNPEFHKVYLKKYRNFEYKILTIYFPRYPLNILKIMSSKNIKNYVIEKFQDDLFEREKP